jgi:hypothetical protein
MTRMDALVIGPPDGLAAAVARALRRRGQRVLEAVPGDVDGDARTAWLLAEAGDPPLVVVCGAAPCAAAARLVGRGRAVIAVEERRVSAARPDGRPARTSAGRALVRAARAAGGEARVVRLGRAGGRWVEPRPGAPAMGAERAAAAVLRPTTGPTRSRR